MDLAIDGVDLFVYSDEYSFEFFPSFLFNEDSSEFYSPSLNFSNGFFDVGWRLRIGHVVKKVKRVKVFQWYQARIPWIFFHSKSP